MANAYLNWLKQLLSKPQKNSWLRNYHIFKDLNSFELHLIHNCLHKRNYHAGESIFEEGHPLEAIFFIVSGEVQIKGKISRDGIAILNQPQFIGVIDLFHENTRNGTAVALTEVSMLVLTKTDFFDLIRLNPRLGNKLLKSCCHFICNSLLDTIPE